MPGKTPSRDEVQKVRDWLKANPGKGRSALAKDFGITNARAYTLLRNVEMSNTSDVTDCPPSETREEHGESLTITLPKTRICTLEQLVAHCKIDLNTWEVERFVVNKWEVGAKDASHKIQVEPLFQVKAWLKRKRVIVSITKQIEALQRKAEGYAPKYPAIILKDLKRTGNLAEISIYDHHFGAYIWGKETGWDNYDTSIADRTFRDSLTDMLSRAKAFGVDRIMLSLGNDIQNSDNRAGTTEAGTQQANDSRYEKVCETVQETAVWAVEACREVAPNVIVPMIRGNHDPLTTFHLGGYLTAWFRKCKGVEIDNSSLKRKAYQHGKVMLMLTHGNGIKIDEYPLLMATEFPKMWAATTWRETHTGHVHTRRKMVPELDEIKGVAVRCLPSLRPPCDWSSGCGYVGNMRTAEAYIWNESRALIGTAVYSVPALQVGEEEKAS